MKTTKDYLKQVIKEEIKDLLRETEPVPRFREIINSYKPFIEKYKNFTFQQFSEIGEKNLENLSKLYMFSEEAHNMLRKIHHRNKNSSNRMIRSEEGETEMSQMDDIHQRIKRSWEVKTKSMPSENIPKLANYSGLKPDDLIKMV